MANRHSIPRAAALASFAAAAALSGCALFRSGIQFTNVSDSFLNVRFFVGEAGLSDQSSELYNDREFQVMPGETAKFSPGRGGAAPGSRRLVHIQIRPVNPSWEPPAKEYWLEVMTNLPVTIVATGTSQKLAFESGIPTEGAGAIALIPERELHSGRYDYRLVGAAEDTAPNAADSR